ncbi:hypothetical protein DPMN_175933 [Dreissena polymorpha]|uniref:Uncharacterized protein n=1 Tax=Dreissena polymorpha TaxID=45954 RepID=A0A9D4E969_DREPO|nr:hypothetical protein DPMN_175933 [Dreissena polymorpha]
MIVNYTFSVHLSGMHESGSLHSAARLIGSVLRVGAIIPIGNLRIDIFIFNCNE